jgi:hypothetical protein
MTKRSTKEVFEDHLRLRKQGDPETDIERNYAEDVIVMSNFGTFHGRDGVRHSEQLLHQQLPSGRHYTYVQQLTDQEIAFEKWDGESERFRVKDGIDFFVMRNGLIQLQLIYYQPIPKERERKYDKTARNRNTEKKQKPASQRRTHTGQDTTAKRQTETPDESTRLWLNEMDSGVDEDSARDSSGAATGGGVDTPTAVEKSTEAAVRRYKPINQGGSAYSGGGAENGTDL